MTTVAEVVSIGIVSLYLTKYNLRMRCWLTQWVTPHSRYDFRLREELGTLWRAFFHGQLQLALGMNLTASVLNRR
ncbi:MAG: hypothetical protein SXV54_19465 [Chloroflexota bacterium]|nr:hypothetical protein [Chloroflexota bacterium]